LVDQNINTNITATANFSSLTAQLQAVTAQLIKLQTTTVGLNQKLQGQIGQMNRSFVDTMRSTGQFSSHFVTLSSDVDKFGKNLDAGRMKLGQYFNTWQSHAKGTTNIVKELAKQQVMLQNAVVQPLGKNAQGLMQYNVMVARGLDENKNKLQLLRQEQAIMNKVMQDGSNQLINWGKNTQWAGRQLTVGLTVPIAAFGAAASKAFRDADAELIRLQKVYGGLTASTTAELEKVRRDVTGIAKEMASAYGVSFKDTIALAADLAATGKQGADLMKATQETTRLAVLGEVDRQDAMKATLAIQNAFKQNTQELTESINFLNAVENQTSTSLADLTEAIPKAGPVIKSLGGDVQDLALYLTAMKEGGVNASEGANAIKSAMASLINPTKVAREMFAGFGIDIAGIVTSNAGDLTGTIVALQKSLDSLDPLSKSKAIEQLFGKFQFARMSALFENLGKEGSQTLQVLDLMKASTQELAAISDRELKMMTESASGKYRRALESVKADLAVIGESFLKINTFILNVIDGIVKFVGKLPGPIKSILTFVGGLTAVAGPLIMLTGVLANFFGYIVKGMFSLKQFFKGGEQFKLLTPELVAADAAAKAVGESFYSDAKAAKVFEDAVLALSRSFDILQTKAAMATQATHSSVNVSTIAGNAVTSGAGFDRVVDKDSPYLGKPYSRDMSHTIPSGQEQLGTIFGVVPGTGPVNRKISNNPQMYMDGDLPRVPGVTSVNSVSTGIVASEAAKWHSMTAAIAMQSKEELALLKQEVAATGTVTAELSASYSAMLPPMVELTSMAAAEGGAIVAELKAGKITVDQARAKIIALNQQVEAMMAETSQMVAASMGRTINLTTVPLTSQPTVDPITGKSNMKEMFHKGTTKNLVDKIARSLGVRTSGGGYSTETTKPIIRRNEGGMVYDPSKHGSVVPGPANVDYDMIPAKLPEGSYILNQEASRKNPSLVNMAKNKYAGGGKVVDAILTPRETYFDPEFTAANKPMLDRANSGSRIEFNSGGFLGGMVRSGIRNYGKMQDMFPAQASGSYELNKTSEYLDFLTSNSYQDDIVPNLIQNDAAAILNNSKDMNMTPTQAVDIAEKAVKASIESHKEYVRTGKGLTYTESQRKFMHDNFPELVITRPNGMNDVDWNKEKKKKAGGNATIRKSILSVLKKRYPGSTIYHDRDRAHIERGTGNIAARGYFGEAAHDPFNRFGNRLHLRGIIDDTVPLTRDEALARAHKLSVALGFKDVDDYRAHVPVIEKWLKTGKWNGRGPIPENLVRALGGDMKVFRSSGTPSKSKTQRQPRTIMIRGRKLQLANDGGMIGGMVSQGKYAYGDPAAAARLKAFADAQQVRRTAQHQKNLERFPWIKPQIDAYRASKKGHFLGMPRGIKAVEEQRKARLAMEEINSSVMTSRFADMDPTDFGMLVSPTTGRSFPVSGIGGLYKKPDGSMVFVKPVMDETAALAEQRATIIAREAHGLNAPRQDIKTMIDPTDPTGKRKLIVLESPFDEAFAKSSGTFTQSEYFKQLVAANLRGDKDLSASNLYGSTLADVGTAGVFKMASGKRSYASDMPSMSDQARINLLGVKGGAKKFFAESTLNIPKGMKAKDYHEAMIAEIDSVLPKLEKTIAQFDLSIDERQYYRAMIDRLKAGRNVNWEEFHGIHSAVKTSATKALTPAALLKLKTESELRMRQRGHAASLSDNAFKNNANGFNMGGMVQARAMGGPVNSGQPYLVGEKGPELFVPKNNGGIVSNYALGGMVRSNKSGYGKYSAFRSKVRGTGTIRTPKLDADGKPMEVDPNSGMASSMAGMAMMMGGQQIGGTIGSGMGFAGMAMQMAPLLPMLTKARTSIAGMGGALKALGSFGPKILIALRAGIAALMGPLGLVSLALGGLFMLWKRYREEQAQNRKEEILSNGITKKGAQEAGIRYNNMSNSIADVNAQLELTRAKGKAAFENLNSAGVQGLSLTIAELKKAIKEAKASQKELVEGFSNAGSGSASTQEKQKIVNEMATNLKAQFVAAGMSAQQATNKIFAIIKASKNADMAFNAISSKGFTEIIDKTTAATSMVEKLNKKMAETKLVQASGGGYKAESSFKGEALGNALSNTTAAIDANMKALVGTKDAMGNVIDEATAYKMTIDDINSKTGSTNTLTKEQIESLKETHPALQEILNTTDTTASAFAKWRIVLSGVRADLKHITAEEAIAIAQFEEGLNSAIEAQEKTGAGVLGKSQTIINKLQLQIGKGLAAQQKAHNQAMGNIEDEIKAIDKKIKKIQEEADAKIKAIEDEQKANDFNANMQQLQIENQDALAKGDMAGAALTQIKIRQLADQRQKELAINAIREKEAKEIDALNKKKEGLAAKQEASAKRLAALQEAAAKTQIRLDKIKTYQLEYENLLKEKANINLMAEGKDKEEAIKAFRGNLGALGQNLSKDATGKDSALASMVKDIFQGTMIGSKGESLAGKISTTYNGRPVTSYVPGIADAKVGAAANDISLKAAESIKGGATLYDVMLAVRGQGKDGGWSKENAIPVPTNYDKYKTRDGGILTDPAKVQIATELGLQKDQYFKYLGKTYRVYDPTQGSRIIRQAKGGPVFGAGSATSDSIPAMLSNGEYVINAKSASAYGYQNLDTINRMAQGGLAVRYDIPSGSKIKANMATGGVANSSQTVYNVNIELNGTNVTVDDVMNKFDQRMRNVNATMGRVVTNRK
jgi:TP901 family phage tail tape measure protein